MPRRAWEIPQREATAEDAFLNRRKFLRQAGLGAMGLVAGCSYEKSFEPFAEEEPLTPTAPSPSEPPLDAAPQQLYPALTNPRFSTLDRPLTDETIASRHNNFYEFVINSKQVYDRVEKFMPRPWTLEVAGLVKKPKTYDVDTLVRKMPLEERLYRLRCVEAWSMALPWTGFSMQHLIDAVEPLSAARYVQMTSFLEPEVAQGQWENPHFPWGYMEGLTMAEATNELTLLASGIYGHELPKQHGAPIRLVVPWKYGFKSIKSIVRIEFTAQPPATFWNTLVPQEYGFSANVEPQVPHPRWSQAMERFIISTAEIEARPTLPYNGYEEFVAHLYT